ncbi:hypothetical protein IQ07DRAFT_55802 [Pyrenochaeta sp. DS3sAY3a]|nr:hypothetical protein IQ07DRAFT_55802 [Pyrenochaeta sp. DS3sAY3a]
MSSVPQAAKTAALASGWPRSHDLMLRAYHLAPGCRQPLFRLAPKVDLASTPEPGSPGRCARVFFLYNFFLFRIFACGKASASANRRNGEPAARRTCFGLQCQTPPGRDAIDPRQTPHHAAREFGFTATQAAGLSLKHSTRDVPPPPMIGRGPHMDRCPFRPGALARSGLACASTASLYVGNKEGLAPTRKPPCGCAPRFPRRTQRSANQEAHCWCDRSKSVFVSSSFNRRF